MNAQIFANQQKLLEELKNSECPLRLHLLLRFETKMQKSPIFIL